MGARAMIVAEAIHSQIGSASFIRRMFEEGIRMKAERGAENVFDFTLGNPSEDPPPAIMDTLRKIAADSPPGSHGYMPNAGYARTREAVAERLGKETGLRFSAGNVIMTCGCAGAMNAALKAIINPGDEVIVPTPFFPDYKFYISNYGGRMIPAATREDFSLDVPAVESLITPKTRVILLNSPNNPSGAVYSEKTLRELDAVIERAGGTIVVISDEPYTSIVYDGVKCPSAAACISNCLITTSWSKKWGLAGERIGYLAISPKIAEAGALFEACVFTNRVSGFVNAPAIWQRVVAEAPDESPDMALYHQKRDILCDGLQKLGYELHKPQGAFYVFPKTPIADDAAFIRLLQEEGVLAVPGSGFGLGGYMRLSLTVPLDTITRSLPSFGRVLDNLDKLKLQK
jgi:aspartate aminotransferase